MIERGSAAVVQVVRAAEFPVIIMARPGWADVHHEGWGLARSAYLESDLALLVETQAVREFLVQRAEDSTEDRPRWVLLVRRGTRWIPVRSKRENPRTWASLDTLERFTLSRGIRTFQVES